MSITFPTVRLRRLRQHPILRDLVRETELNLKDLILPLFIKGKRGENKSSLLCRAIFKFLLTSYNMKWMNF